MSYDIIYDRQFIKAKKEDKEVFFPIIYAGCSNVFDVGFGRNRIGRRSRDWENYKYLAGRKQYGTAATLIASTEQKRAELIEQYKNDETPYTDRAFGWITGLQIGSGHTTSTTFAMYQSLVKTGIKKALTVEQLLELRIDVEIFSYSYDKKDEQELIAEGIQPFRITIKTSEELVQLADEKTELYKNSKHSFYIKIRASELQMKRLRQTYFPVAAKSPRPKKVLSSFFVLERKEGGYFAKNTKYGYKYNTFPEATSVKKFEKQPQADKYLADKIRNQRKDEFIVTPITLPEGKIVLI